MKTNSSDLIQDSVVTSTVRDVSLDALKTSINDSKQNGLSNGSADHVEENGTTFTFEDKWGLNILDVYRLALKFYREKYGKAGLQIPYSSKVKLVAFVRQVSHGPYRPELMPDIGILDVIGSDRKQAWSSLGEMSKDEAMIRFVDLLDALCPLFKPYIEAHKRDREIRDRKERDEEDDRKKTEEDEMVSLQLTPTAPLQPQLTAEQEQQIREALNLQTMHQFRAFCEQQLPGKPEEQKLLIEKLQEEHFRQYLKRWMEAAANPQNPVNGDVHHHDVADQSLKKDDPASDEESEDVLQGSGVGETVQAASVWTRADIKEFKESVKNEGGEGVLKIGQGETVTIRVPTHPEGNYLFWEFATDNYDLGFGLLFEWSNNTNENRVTIHVSESDEEDEEFGGEGSDPERGSGNSQKNPGGPPIDEIIPIFRRDSHEEVIAGSHLYPARQGVYLLKFDNSFSLWRSKTLYYRVYYTR